MPYTQTNRIIAINTPLGPDVLLLRRVTGQEGISQLFNFELDLLSTDAAIKFEDIIGKNVTVKVSIGDDEERFFNGFISRFSQLGNDTGLANYQATMVPWIWFLSRTTDCRIFQNLSIPDIIKKIFQDLGFSEFKFSLKGTYQPWDYCVQYRETDLNFVCRLMEQEGIFYYFEHEEKKHTLVIADDPSVHQPCSGQSKVEWNPQGSGNLDESVVTDLQLNQEFKSGKYALTDYNFETPSTSLMVEVSTTIPVASNTKLEVYDYPGEYDCKADGNCYARVRMQEEEAQRLEVSGSSSCRTFTSGYRFTLEEYFRPDMNREYLLTSVHHSASVGNTYTSQAGGGEQDYDNHFVCIPYAVPYRPQRITPRPVVQGPQTAVVVGPRGEEIYVDKYGRVKVQFFWDREGRRDENSSCWVRVSQTGAGKSWGGMFIPRIGQEVIVEFMEGDPDQPIITGRVYNAEQMPPYELPANQTQSGIKSRSTKGGSPANFNEIRFEDKKGSEEIYVHGEKDWTIHIKNNESETIGSNLSSSAGGNISQSAGVNISRTANANINDKAGDSISTEAVKDMMLKAGGSYALHTSLGIHLKAMNFVAAAIESGAKAAADALMKGGAAGAKGAGPGIEAKVDAAAAEGGKAAVAAFGPAVAAVTADLHARQAQAEKNMGKAEASGTAVGKAAAELDQAISSGASGEVIAGAVMALASAGLETYKDAKRLIEDMLPQIPSIVMWAMKDISATALWSMSLQTKIKDISIEAKNKNINIKAKRDLNLEAATKDLNVKASKKNLNITGKEKVSIKAEDKAFVIEAGKDKLTIKSPKMIMLKVKSSAVCLTEDGILINSKKVKVKGTSGPVEVKGTPIKLN
jgi:type VI secretion system secreted protein VgrG